jgi:ATP-dependent RNA helicase RhlE
MPDTVDAYTHRIGRTGRAEETGKAFTLALPEDASLVRQIEKAVGEPIERRRVPSFDYGGFRPEDALSGNGNGAQRANGANQRHHRNGNGNGSRRRGRHASQSR